MHTATRRPRTLLSLLFPLTSASCPRPPQHTQQEQTRCAAPPCGTAPPPQPAAAGLHRSRTGGQKQAGRQARRGRQAGRWRWRPWEHLARSARSTDTGGSQHGEAPPLPRKLTRLLLLCSLPQEAALVASQSLRQRPAAPQQHAYQAREPRSAATCARVGGLTGTCSARRPPPSPRVGWSLSRAPQPPCKDGKRACGCATVRAQVSAGLWRRTAVQTCRQQARSCPAAPGRSCGNPGSLTVPAQRVGLATAGGAAAAPPPAACPGATR